MWNVFPSADDLFVYNCPRRTEDDEDVVGLATTLTWLSIFSVSCDKYCTIVERGWHHNIFVLIDAFICRLLPIHRPPGDTIKQRPLYPATRDTHLAPHEDSLRSKYAPSFSN